VLGGDSIEDEIEAVGVLLHLVCIARVPSFNACAKFTACTSHR
jgi:hypothetical protein